MNLQHLLAESRPRQTRESGCKVKRLMPVAAGATASSLAWWPPLQARLIEFTHFAIIYIQCQTDPGRSICQSSFIHEFKFFWRSSSNFNFLKFKKLFKNWWQSQLFQLTFKHNIFSLFHLINNFQNMAFSCK